MNVVFHPDANREFLEAIDCYEAQQPGLGEDFYNEIMATVLRIAEGPLIWPVLGKISAAA